MPGRYAQGTDVSIPSSMMEITRILDRYHVEEYTFGNAPGKAGVQFVLKGTPIRVEIPLPDKPAREKGINTATGREINLVTRWEQEKKEAWRALVLLLKANLEAVERKIVSLEQAFMAFLVVPDGRTIGDVVLPAYREALTTGRLALTSGEGS